MSGTASVGDAGGSRGEAHRPRLGLASLAVVGVASWVLASGVGKLTDAAAFHDALGAHGVLPGELVGAMTWTLPAIELATASWAIWRVLTGRPVRAGALALAGLFAALALYSTIVAFNPPPSPTPCGCGLSRAPVESWWPIVLRNAAVLGALLIASRRGRASLSGAALTA